MPLTDEQKKEVVNYDIDRLKEGIEKMKQNIESFEQAISAEEAKIDHYKEIIMYLEVNGSSN